MGKKIALYTFGVFIKPAEHPINDDFHDLNDQVLPIVDRATGFIARSGYDDEPGPPSWGIQVFPRFYQERGDGWSPSTLSLWVDMESAMAFSYFGLHAKALKRGKEWHVTSNWPPYAVWWVDHDHTPDWVEAVEMHSYLHDHGPTLRVFDFKTPFDPKGNEMALCQRKIKAAAEQNSRQNNT